MALQNGFGLPFGFPLNQTEKHTCKKQSMWEMADVTLFMLLYSQGGTLTQSTHGQICFLGELPRRMDFLVSFTNETILKKG